MAHNLDPNHPRYISLQMRENIVQAAKQGLLADSALIAHGRGEAFDYLLGETTIEAAMIATIEAAARLIDSNNPIISLNGNSIALAGEDLLRCAAIIGCDVEVNIYYRTPERVRALVDCLENYKLIISTEKPEKWTGNLVAWKKRVSKIRILGNNPTGIIPGLTGPRAKCHENGIQSADVILVPLEDGDRCKALIENGKQVLVVDLNPLSRTAVSATVTIVDELTRVAANLFEALVEGVDTPNQTWNNLENLQSCLDIISTNLNGKFVF